ncbi:hypothetical protein GQ54DRAFT_161862 [Martensiomyces pterosporus]|nr:hypothetical protein GQ54DRAFT_161862 [Martensiomyces pterosporus]
MRWWVCVYACKMVPVWCQKLAVQRCCSAGSGCANIRCGLASISSQASPRQAHCEVSWVQAPHLLLFSCTALKPHLSVNDHPRIAMLFTRPLLAQNRRAKFGDQSLPRMKTVPKDKFRGMSKRQLCWTVIIVTIPLITVYSNILYKRLVLGEEKRRTYKEGGLDSGYLMDNIASSRRPAGSSSHPSQPPQADE